METVAFYTLGCKVNQYETEAMRELFEKCEYTVVETEEKADVYVINTCTVTNLGDRKSRQFIRRAKRNNPNSIIAVVGCYAQTAPDKVMSIEGVDIILGTKDRNKIVDYVEKVKTSNKKINAVKDIMGTKQFEEMKIEKMDGKTRAYLKIQEGCNQYCSYCIIPYARGPVRSRNLEDIVQEAHRIEKSGFKEVILTGIHVASYGKDLGDVTLLDVINSIHNVDGIRRIRLSSIEPTIMTERFVEKLSKLQKVCPHFHLSLQSGCDATLKRMNRKYTTSEYRDVVNRLRNIWPEVSITTDIMVGFPGETEEEFKKTIEFVKEIKFAQIHVFKYSPRKGTPASKYKNQIPSQTKQKRSEELIHLAQQSSISFRKKFIGTEREVLFETSSHELQGYYDGFTDNYIRVLCPMKEISLEGKISKVCLEKIYNDAMIGTVFL
jgi:threonylcarbamoyladenosine tRNA methylthiotransferase MtaB